MIKLNNKTQQDFLNRKWVQKLLDAGIDMSDAKYCICEHVAGTGLKGEYIYLKQEAEGNSYISNILPTYSLAELLYKLNEWPSREVSGKLIGTPLVISKDAPFYMFGYEFADNPIECITEYPIESAAMLLRESAKSDFVNFKYTADISNK